MLDLFGGAGSTLIACEQTGRRATVFSLYREGTAAVEALTRAALKDESDDVWKEARRQLEMIRATLDHALGSEE